jgi:hypothetical protein
MTRARSCSLPFILSRIGVPTSTCRPCCRASSSVASLSSGCRTRIELIFSRRRAFLFLSSSFATPSGVSGNSTVVPATWSGVAERSEGGCNSELGFCGISGKSGGRVGGLTGGGSFWALAVWLGHCVSPQDIEANRVEPRLFPMSVWACSSTQGHARPRRELQRRHLARGEGRGRVRRRGG